MYMCVYVYILTQSALIASMRIKLFNQFQWIEKDSISNIKEVFEIEFEIYSSIS